MRKFVHVALNPALGIAMNWVMRGGRLVTGTAPGMLTSGDDAAGAAQITPLRPRASQIETVRAENTQCQS